MAKTITILNGTGSGNLVNGSYSVTSNSTGYDNTSISPSNVTIEAGTNSYQFTISATGTLTLHVTEDGTSSGTPIIGATFVRTDSSGNEYGAEITSDTNGDAVFNNVPYSDSSAPTIYFKQLSSDGSHEFDSSVQNTTLSTSTSTMQITNTIGALRTITLTDSNYQNLPIENASLTLTN